MSMCWQRGMELTGICLPTLPHSDSNRTRSLRALKDTACTSLGIGTNRKRI